MTVNQYWSKIKLFKGEKEFLFFVLFLFCFFVFCLFVFAIVAVIVV